MNRRQYIISSVAVGTAGVAGCFDDNESEIERLENTIDELEQTENELQNEVTNLENQVRDLETEKATLEEEVDRSQKERGEVVKEILTNRYNAAFAYYELGREEYNTAIDDADTENWTAAAKFFGIAFRSFDTVQELTFLTSKLAEEEEHNDVEDIVIESNNLSERLRNASEHYSLGSEYFAIERNERGQNEFDRGDEYIDEADLLQFESPRTFELALK